MGFLLPVATFAVLLIVEAHKPDPERDLSASLTKALRFDRNEDEVSTAISPDAPEWRVYYPKTSPMKIGEVSLEASVAASWPERIKGLSDTPFLPEEVAKFFVFDSSGFHSIWMKDMNYAIDIIWVNELGEIVHIVENASPDSYPETFTPDSPARYVIEVVSGFVARHGITYDSSIELPEY
jgi:uncharacterized membrane protein (UPF0127 family)